MTTPATPAVPQTIEQKIVLATQESAQIVQAFSPAAAALIQAGVAVEPVMSGIIHMIIGIFRHHTKTAAAVAPPLAVPLSAR
jgi:hypothetical protein